MKRAVRLSTAAEADLDRLAQFLQEHSPRAAAEAARTIRDAILQLADFPMLGIATEGARRRLTIRFGASGYAVEYRVDTDTVIIARIFHMREDRP